MIGALLTTLFFALTAVCANRAAQLIGSSLANLFRLLIAVTLLGVWAFSLGVGLSGGVFLYFFCAGCIGFGLGGFSMFQALPRLGSPLSMLIVECVAAVSAAFFAISWLGQSLNLLELIFIPLILSGVVIGLLPRVDRKIPFNKFVVGVPWAFMAGIAQGLGLVVTKKAFGLLKSSGILMDGGTAAFQRLLGGLAIAVLGYIIVKIIPDRGNHDNKRLQREPLIRKGPLNLHRMPFLWVFLNALFGPVLGVSCMMWAVRELHPAIVQSIISISPLLAVPFAYIMENSKPGIGYYVGAILAICGLTGLHLSGM